MQDVVCGHTGREGEALTQLRPMPTGLGPEAAVTDSGVFERKPKADARIRFGIEKRRILMQIDDAPDLGMLEYMHALQDHGLSYFVLHASRSISLASKPSVALTTLL